MAEHENEYPSSKRLKLEDESRSDVSEESSLVKFCDDLLLEIFSYLRHLDLIALSKCCQRFKNIASDRTLWTAVDLRHVPLSEAQLQDYVKFFLPVTKFIATKGHWRDHRDLETGAASPLELECSDTPTVTVALIESIAKSAQNLTTLIFENHILGDWNVKRDFIGMVLFQLTWDKFPNTIENLALRNCHFRQSQASPSDTTIKSYFFGISSALPNLKTLDLSGSLWFQSHSLLTLSKCSGLLELRLADCPLSDLVPYISLSTRFGFGSLAVVDLRRTWVSDREVSCLSKTESLRELLLEAPADPAGPILITDLALTTFGGSPGLWNQLGFHIIAIDDPTPRSPPSLRSLQVTNYRTVTDISLQHCADCLRDLRRLDVRGTAVTRDRVIHFSYMRPEVTILSDYDLEAKTDET